MALEKSYLFYALLVVTVCNSVIKAATCGKSQCHEKGECKLNDNYEQYCDCEMSYTKTEIENNVYCCSKAGENCAINRKCNSNLECLEISAEYLEESKELVEPLSCTESEKCKGKCCAKHEICSVAVQECIPIDILDPYDLNETIRLPVCPAVRKCHEKCCAEDEECNNDETKCVAKEGSHSTAKFIECVANQLCADKCCAKHEICSVVAQKCIPKDILNENESMETFTEKSAVFSVSSLTTGNVKFMQHEPTNESAVTEEVATFNDASVIGCKVNQQCLDKCCAEEEICSVAAKKCIPRNILNVIELPETSLPPVCLAAQKCQDECCAEDEECNKEETECVPKEEPQSLPKTSNEASARDCSVNQQCADKCCAEKEICSVAAKKCIPRDILNVIELPETSLPPVCLAAQKCQDECCAEDEICSVAENKCVLKVILDTYESTTTISEKDIAFSMQPNTTDNVKFVQQSSTDESASTEEVTTASMNCPQKQKCLDKCCSSHELCSDLKECVKKDFGNLWSLYDFSNEELNNAKTTTKKVNNDIEIKLTCLSDEQLCEDKCCSAQQTCNDMWQCVSKSRAENAKVTTGKAAMAYTMIGSGVLVASLAFGAFKLYDFRRSKRNLY